MGAMSKTVRRVVDSRPPHLGGSANALACREEPLLEIYNRYFVALAADTPALVRRAQEIRYQVYCVENPFENPAEHPDGCESDTFDSHAIHSLLVHRPSGQAMGTVRLVLPFRDAPYESFAIQHLMDPLALEKGEYFPISTTGEVSRFSISKEFRRRVGDTLYGGAAGPTSPSDRRRGPLMCLGLIQSLVRMSVLHGITHWCAVMEPKLLRMLANMSIHFEPIGDPVEYHGRRQPCYCQVDTVLKQVKSERREFWEVLAGHDKQYRSENSEPDFLSGCR